MGPGLEVEQEGGHGGANKSLGGVVTSGLVEGDVQEGPQARSGRVKRMRQERSRLAERSKKDCYRHSDAKGLKEMVSSKDVCNDLVQDKSKEMVIILKKQRRRSQQFCPAPQPVEWITQPLLLPQK